LARDLVAAVGGRTAFRGEEKPRHGTRSSRHRRRAASQAGDATDAELASTCRVVACTQEVIMADNDPKNPREKQPGEQPEGKYHYNPGNQSGKTADVIVKPESKRDNSRQKQKQRHARSNQAGTEEIDGSGD